MNRTVYRVTAVAADTSLILFAAIANAAWQERRLHCSLTWKLQTPLINACVASVFQDGSFEPHIVQAVQWQGD